ncbi:hypothetical protein ACIRL2_26755 [Embleya sp. NPDC127516]|uniref:hypothetical protein n=1 Tax=Embleya sp. NPDC127516 TaxID=3363990 RepID=UPI0037FE2DCB
MATGILSKGERRAWCALVAELRLGVWAHGPVRAGAAPPAPRLRIVAAVIVLAPVAVACGVVAATRLSHPLVLVPRASLAALGALPLPAWASRHRHRCRHP